MFETLAHGCSRRRLVNSSMKVFVGCNLTHDYFYPRFCAECKPREKPRTPRKARRVFSEESEDEAVEEEEAEAGEEEAEVEAEEGESEMESIHNETCPVCQEGGEVICCDTCPAVYHLECINPPMRKVPRGKWSCPQCKTPPQDKDRGKLREKSKSF